MYRVEIINQELEDGAFRTDEKLAYAICEANDAANAITDKALLIGIMQWAVVEEKIDSKTRHAAEIFLDSFNKIPCNMSELDSMIRCSDCNKCCCECPKEHPDPIKVSDIPINNDVVTANESGYRRGYCHAYYAAFNSINEGRTAASLEQFVLGELFTWRYSKHSGEVILPPIQ